MNKNWLVFSLALALSGEGLIVHAADQDVTGNSDVGKAKAASCAGCHGEDGNSMVPMYPKLAQQHPNYLAKQLHNLKSQERNSAVMSPMAAALSEKDIADIAAYYAEQTIQPNGEPVLPPDDEDAKPADGKVLDINALVDKGSNLYRNGDLPHEVSACIACHGPFGEGNGPAGFPALRAQHAEYVIKSLTDFKSGARSNNPENMMHMIAKKMTDEEIKAVAYYISTLK
jgi:cytochrome c553